MVTQKQLKELFDYNPKTGLFTRKIHVGRKCRAGSIAGTRTIDGYIRIGIDRKTYFAHRLAWLYVYGKWPKNQIDHKNMNKSDNRLKNLREATHSQNQRNRGMPANNTTGYKRVDFVKKYNKYRARIKRNGVETFLGHFDTAEEAGAVAALAALEHDGKFARF